MRNLAQPSITNVTSIREEETILAATNGTPIREITTVMSDLINKLTTNGTTATAQGKIK